LAVVSGRTHAAPSRILSITFILSPLPKSKFLITRHFTAIRRPFPPCSPSQPFASLSRHRTAEAQTRSKPRLRLPPLQSIRDYFLYPPSTNFMHRLLVEWLKEIGATSSFNNTIWKCRVVDQEWRCGAPPNLWGEAFTFSLLYVDSNILSILPFQCSLSNPLYNSEPPQVLTDEKPHLAESKKTFRPI